MIIYKDNDIVVAIKPSGVVSTDEINGFPSMIRQELGSYNETLKTVHRLDQVVSGVMILARNLNSAKILTEQIMNNKFNKSYLAIIHGIPNELNGTFKDLLIRDKLVRKTYVTKTASKDSREAILNYETIECKEGLSLVKISLITGRTHQIRVQFSSRVLPIVGDKKYSSIEDECNIALWSYLIEFNHPTTGERLLFTKNPPNNYPYNLFEFFNGDLTNEPR